MHLAATEFHQPQLQHNKIFFCGNDQKEKKDRCHKTQKIINRGERKEKEGRGKATESMKLLCFFFFLVNNFPAVNKIKEQRFPIQFFSNSKMKEIFCHKFSQGQEFYTLQP